MKLTPAATWMLALAIGPGLASTTLAQQGGQPKPPVQHEPEHSDSRQDTMPDDPAQAKKYIERRLEENAKREERLRAALKRLEQGASPVEVGKDLDPNARPPRANDRANGDRPNGDRPARAKITPEEREQALVFLRENSPTLSARFDQLLKTDPDTADRVLGHMSGRIREMKADKERNPILFKLRLEEMEGGALLMDAVKAYRDAKNATPPDVGRLNQATEQLRSALSRQLDTRLGVQADEIDSLTKRLADLKADLEKKRAAREGTIDSMFTKVSEGKEVRELAPQGERGRRGQDDGPDGARSPAPGGPPAAPKRP